MGEAFSQAVLGLPAPRIGLLNVGVEELKGDERLAMRCRCFARSPLSAQFLGFVEGMTSRRGRRMLLSLGFTGNIALKRVRGRSSLQPASAADFQNESADENRLYSGASGLRRMREWIDPRQYNGAVFVGLMALSSNPMVAPTLRVSLPRLMSRWTLSIMR